MPHCAPAVVGTFPQCTSASGAVDMIGNVSEWVAECGTLGDGGPGTPCQHRGGSFEDDAAAVAATCYGTIPVKDTNDTRDRSVGLRCCAALSDTEKKTANQ
jgi:formylglycine-generating enzyme required for sulfatase activity